MPLPEQPYIVIDFEVDAEHVFLLIRNLSVMAATNVQIKSSSSIPALDGTSDLRSLALFKGITYLAPHKELRIFVDSYDRFFHRLKNKKIAFAVTYDDENGRAHRQHIEHDLAIYGDMIFFIKKD